MEIVTVILVAFALAMDAFAVSVATGAVNKDIKFRYAIRMALFFGLFQGTMPLAGHFAGLSFKDAIAAYDHWIAFGLLFGIGCKMIIDARKHTKEQHPNPVNLSVLLMLSVATSIDALAVGVTLQMITLRVFSATALIGIITFVLSGLGCRIGQKIGHIFENRIEIAAGIVLMAIGGKILVEHLLAV